MQVSYRMGHMSKVNNTLRAAIEKSEKSRYRLSKETGIEQSQLSRFMYGNAHISVERIEELAKALGYELILRKRVKKRRKV